MRRRPMTEKNGIRDEKHDMALVIDGGHRTLQTKTRHLIEHIVDVDTSVFLHTRIKISVMHIQGAPFRPDYHTAIIV